MSHRKASSKTAAGKSGEKAQLRLTDRHGRKPPKIARRWALRFALILLLAGAGFGLGGVGGQWFAMTGGNGFPPGFRLSNVPIDAWITPPVQTGLAPIMLSMASSHDRHDNELIDVPEGSVLNVQMTLSGAAPSLLVDGEKFNLSALPEEENSYAITRAITGGKTIVLRRGWRTLASWPIRVIRDAPPHIAFTEPPDIRNRNLTRLAFEVSDDYGVEQVLAHISPTNASARAENIATVALTSPRSRHLKSAELEDLTFLPWAGSPVDIRLEARDARGQASFSDTMTVALPKRSFTHPLARALIEEREKLLRQPEESVRDEAANIMAGISRETANYKNDPVVLMALRAGAVRLVLDRGNESVPAVSLLLWETAARIEDNASGDRREFLRQAKKDGE